MDAWDECAIADDELTPDPQSRRVELGEQPGRRVGDAHDSHTGPGRDVLEWDLPVGGHRAIGSRDGVAVRIALGSAEPLL